MEENKLKLITTTQREQTLVEIDDLTMNDVVALPFSLIQLLFSVNRYSVGLCDERGGAIQPTSGVAGIDYIFDFETPCL